MIPYVEIRDKYSLKVVAIIEAQEKWLELGFQDVGEFEIYCRASTANLNALQTGRFVTIPNKRFVWIITAIQYTNTAGGTPMISATGYEAKWLLSKRCIFTPKEISGTITNALYGLVNHALGTGAQAARTINKFFVDTNNLTGVTLESTQAPRGNLLEFVASLLKSHDCGHIVTIHGETLKYTIFKGTDKTQSVIFSQSVDNLLSSEYLTDEAEVATCATVVSTVDEQDFLLSVANGATGIDRAEIIVNSNLSTTYTDEATGEEVDIAPTSELYKKWQADEGSRALAEHSTTKKINGEIDLTHSLYVFDKDFFLGDAIKLREEYFNFSANTKITKFTMKQDANGYGEEAEYGG